VYNYDVIMIDLKYSEILRQLKNEKTRENLKNEKIYACIKKVSNIISFPIKNRYEINTIS